MEQTNPHPKFDLSEEWHVLLRRYKERLAQRLWTLPTVSEAEKEMLFREMLSDLDQFESEIQNFQTAAHSKERSSKEENDLLRSLLGVPGDELKTRILTITQELASIRKSLEEREEESSEVKRRYEESTEENEQLRNRLRELENGADQFRLQQMKLREDDIRFFSENHEGLKNQLKDLESRLSNLRHLFAQANDKYLSEKQEEISLLQSRLLDEMEAALRKKQQLSWNEEEMFAKGVAHRVRTALVSAQGQLMLTLERLGLLDPETKTEAFWKARLRLLVEGAGELSKNFKSIQALLHDVTATLDDYLHLTHRREITREPVSLNEIVQAEMAELYADRRPTLSVEFLSDDPMPNVSGDPALLRFILKELMKNALEALPAGSGKIVISLKNQISKQSVQVLLRDTGTGIPEHLQSRLFQPFFSTKEHRQGLSLSRAKRYAEFHGGELVLIQTSPNGTTFQLELPLGESQPMLERGTVRS